MMFFRNKQFHDGQDQISTDNYANLKLRYYYFIPDSIHKNSSRTYNYLICVPGLSTPGSFFVNKQFKDFALYHSIIIIAPSFNFDRKNWQHYTSYQYPYHWSGDALLSIINQEQEKGIRLNKLFLYGFSAGAQFVLRFSLLKPELCQACAAHASGGIIKPHTYKNIKYFISVGNKDFDRYNNAAIFVNRANLVKMNVKFNVYNTGHQQTKQQIGDTINFFRKNLSTK